METLNNINDILGGRKKMPDVPVKIEFDIASSAVFLGLAVLAGLMFMLVVKVVK